MQYCSTCGGTVRLRRPDGDSHDRHICSSCGTVHYLNPKVVVGAVCMWQDKVLLCRRAIEPRVGFWTIPAGYLEIGETTAEGAVREAFEEATARIEIDGLLALYNILRLGQVQVLYRARLLSPALEAGIETIELDLFPFSSVPWQELAFQTVDWVLKEAIAKQHHEGPLIPAHPS